MDQTFTLGGLVAILAAVMSIAGFFAWINKPLEQIKDHERRIKAQEDEAEKREAREKFTISALNALVNHMIDGNNTDELRRVRDEYQREIINH
jgi:hypothetical protein